MTALLFVFGLIFGSFLNVVSFRYSEEKNLFGAAHLGGRSHCQHCYQQLAWYELVPVFSFLLQKGKCWACYKKLSWQYLLVELATGFIFVLPLYLYDFRSPESLLPAILWPVAFLVFLLVWTIDFRLFIIPDELNFLLVTLGLILTDFQNSPERFGPFAGSFLGSYAALFGLRGNIWVNHLLAALLAASLVGLVIFFTKGKGMGLGDLNLLAALGFLYGWPDVLLIFILAVLIGSAVSLVLVFQSKKNLQSAVPFGPFLIIGSLLVFFYGEAILRSYFNFFGF